MDGDENSEALSGDEKMFLQNIEEYVLDEEKIVTYKWLSKMLNVHVNQSKQLLYTFYSNEVEKGLVSAMHLLAGKLRKDGGFYITVVSAEDLGNVKPLFSTITSEHIYSVQKSKKPLSLSTLYNADTQPTGDNNINTSKLSAIRCSESVQRAAEELSRLRISLQPVPPINVKKTVETTSISSDMDKKKSSNPPEEDKSVPTTKSEGKSKSGIAAMFAAQSSKAAAAKPSTSVTSNKGTSKGRVGNISSFFNKVSKDDTSKVKEVEKVDAKAKEVGKVDAKAKEVEKMDAKAKEVEKVDSKAKEVEKVDVKVKKEVEKLDVKAKESMKTKPVPVNVRQTSGVNPKENCDRKETKIVENSSTIKSASKATKGKSKRREKGKPKPEAKKRKRIVVMDSESSDDDMFGEDDLELSHEQSPEPDVPILEAKALESEDEDVIPSTPLNTIIPGRSRRRRKVTKDKTYRDDDGYIVTEKVSTYESFSESDSENSGTKKIKETNGQIKNTTNTNGSVDTASKSAPPPPLKKVSPVKSKQQSLMNFFKKKEN